MGGTAWQGMAGHGRVIPHGIYWRGGKYDSQELVSISVFVPPDLNGFPLVSAD